MPNTSLFKKSFSLAWPISLQNMLVTLLSMVDVLMVSHLGNAAIAAVGLGNRITFVVQILIFGLAWGVGVMSAQYFGAGKLSKIRATVLRSVIIAWVALIPIIIATFYYAASLMQLGSDDEQVIALGEQYLFITMPSMLFIAIILIFENAIRSINHVRIPLIFSTLAISLNVVFNYWFINGGLGVDALGVEGAAWATFIARLFHLALLLYVLIKIKHPLKPKRIDLASLKRGFAPWLKLIKLVTPMMFSFGVWSLGTFVYQLIYGQMGTSELAVMSLLTPIEGLYIALFFGLASACSIIIGQHLGANRFDQAWQAVKQFTLYAPLGAFVFGLLMLALKNIVLLMFFNLDAATFNTLENIYILIAMLAWLKVINMTIAMGALRAGGDNNATLLIDVIGMWVVSIPLTYYIAFEVKAALIYVVLAANSEELCKCILFTLRLRSKKWLRNLTKNNNTATKNNKICLE